MKKLFPQTKMLQEAKAQSKGHFFIIELRCLKITGFDIPAKGLLNLINSICDRWHTFSP